jgi:hypothetical protein
MTFSNSIHGALNGLRRLSLRRQDILQQSSRLAAAPTAAQRPSGMGRTALAHRQAPVIAIRAPGDAHLTCIVPRTPCRSPGAALLPLAAAAWGCFQRADLHQPLAAAPARRSITTGFAFIPECLRTAVFVWRSSRLSWDYLRVPQCKLARQKSVAMALRSRGTLQV